MTALYCQAITELYSETTCGTLVSSDGVSYADGVCTINGATSGDSLKYTCGSTKITKTTSGSKLLCDASSPTTADAFVAAACDSGTKTIKKIVVYNKPAACATCPTTAKGASALAASAAAAVAMISLY